jgi:catechol 2,3-dioxygenase-like lactoylglutathione lyase family enzyme
MARIRHLAITTDDTAALADFYMKTFEMIEVMRRPKVNGAVYLSDGYMNLAILPSHGDPERKVSVGINHFGFQVDDMQTAETLALEHGAAKAPFELPKDGRFAETFILDPDGQRVDLSQDGWKTSP